MTNPSVDIAQLEAVRRLKPAHRKLLDDTCNRLVNSAGDALVSLVLYGSAARGDYHPQTSDVNLLIVLSDLELATLGRVAEPLCDFASKGQPMPRLLTLELVREAADVFPVELLDIESHHVVLHGQDPFVDMRVDRTHLRTQCERELREKMMRLSEGFLQARGKQKDLERLLVASYPTFVALFRGCLHLLLDDTQEVMPTHNADVAHTFCRVADIDAAPFVAIESLASGRSVGDTESLFARYYAALGEAVARIDRFSA